jgi:hypothetical protein
MFYPRTGHGYEGFPGERYSESPDIIGEYLIPDPSSHNFRGIDVLSAVMRNITVKGITTGSCQLLKGGILGRSPTHARAGSDAREAGEAGGCSGTGRLRHFVGLGELIRQSARDYDRAGRSAGSGSLDRVVPDRDFAWVSGCGGRSTAVGLPDPESCADDESLDETTTATPMIKTTSADKVQERRSESSRLCMGILSAPGGYPHCDRDHKLPGSSVSTPVRTAVRGAAAQPAGCAASAALTAFCPKRCTAA